MTREKTTRTVMRTAVAAPELAFVTPSVASSAVAAPKGSGSKDHISQGLSDTRELLWFLLLEPLSPLPGD